MQSLWTCAEIDAIQASFIDHSGFSNEAWRGTANPPEPELSVDSLFNETDLERMSLVMTVKEHAEQNYSSLPTNYHPHLRTSTTPSSFTFEIDRQRRPGAHHGLGGRPRGMNSVELQKALSPQISSKICRFLTLRCDNNPELVAMRLKEALLDTFRAQTGAKSIQISANYSIELLKSMKDIMKAKEKPGYEVLEAPYLAICFKVPKTGTIDSGSGNPMDRHCTSTWLDEQGKVHCSCVGSTSFRIRQDAFHVDYRNCMHIDGFARVIKAISSSFDVPDETAAIALARLRMLLCDTEISQYTRALPKLHFHHKSSVIVVSLTESLGIRESVLFVPVRHITKKSVRNVCAYCDNVQSGNCHHTRTIAMIMQEDVFVSDDSGAVEQSQTIVSEVDESVSFLPLSPVNCAKSLQVDQLICELARDSKPYVLNAPTTCFSCGSARIESSRVVSMDGVLMCTIGACRMYAEEFQCSSATCRSKIMAEGREHCILIDRITTGATHALMRRELFGVVISNGTLTGRLRHFHSLVTANAYFGIIPPEPVCRSVKTLLKLCSVMLKLMCVSPPQSLFHCNTCEFDGMTPKPRLMALCMDGINQGFVKGSSKPFKNISEECTPIKTSTSARGRAESLMRPLTCLVRESRPVAILLDAIKGSEIACTSSNEKDFASAARMVSSLAIPSQFHSSISICGRSRGDVSEDIGDNSTLSAIQKFVTSLFDESSLLVRILKPLLKNVKDVSSRNYMRTVLNSAKSSVSPTTAPNEVCWREALSNVNSGHIRNDLFNLFRLVVQGPILQFVKRSDTTSLTRLSELCCQSDLCGVQGALQDPDMLLESGNMKETNILRSLTVLRAGLVSIKEVEMHHGCSSIRKSFGSILGKCSEIVLRFYGFYETSSRSESAFIYEKNWSSSDDSELSTAMREKYGFHFETSRLLYGNNFYLAVQTGSFFPGRPQLRPLPFNDEESTEKNFDSVATCSKDFLQRQKSFTPGALTFCCSCSRPKILGFKVLHRNEGPRAILDTVISRFGTFPKHLIYDFCCGLFTSAIHCVWWALSNLSIVCDHFHIKNHSCSPGFSPVSHFPLHATNTVAHEQRNRAIKRLGLSLRNCNKQLYISLLAYQTIVLNIRAQAKGTIQFAKRTAPYSDYDIEWCYFDCLLLKCNCCSS